MATQTAHDTKGAVICTNDQRPLSFLIRLLTR